MTTNTEVINRAYELACDVQGVLEEIWSTGDMHDLQASADELLRAALRFDRFVQETVVIPLVVRAETGSDA